jgi:hypothetical protein
MNNDTSADLPLANNLRPVRNAQHQQAAANRKFAKKKRDGKNPRLVVLHEIEFAICAVCAIECARDIYAESIYS